MDAIAHDFFTPQPVRGATLYVLRMIVHDWPDNDAKNILKQLREAASESSKLVLFETLAYHLCTDPDTEISAPKSPAPFPLLANLGTGNATLQTFLDMHVRASAEENNEALIDTSDVEHTQRKRTQRGRILATRSVCWMVESIVPVPINVFTFSAV